MNRRFATYFCGVISYAMAEESLPVIFTPPINILIIR